jgi:hypothetical protein
MNSMRQNATTRVESDVSAGRARNVHRVALALVILVGVTFSFAIYKLPLAAYVQDINVDDSFYYYNIAKNFSHGLFSTFDGINLTNGYHPIWAFLLIPVFIFVKDPITALRVAKMEEFGLLLVAASLAMSAGREAKWRASEATIIPVWLFSSVVYFMGIEVSAQVLMLFMLMFFLSRLFGDTENRILWIAVAIDCALLPWVRLECIAVSLLTAAAITFYMFWRRGSVSWDALLVWVGAIGGGISYFIYNKLIFGTFVPVSGQIKEYWSKAQFAQEGGYRILSNMLTFLKHEKRIEAAALICLLIVAGSWLIPVYRERTYSANHGIDAFILILAGAFTARMTFSIWSLNIRYNVPWYYVSGLLLLALTVPLAISRGFLIAGLLRAHPIPRLESYVGITALAVAIIILNPYRDVAKWQRGWRAEWGSASFEGAEWMNTNLPAGAIIGSSDSGIVGYFSQHPVINLDGLVNSKDFLSAVRNQSVEAWIKKERINYLANAMWTNVSGCSFMASASAQIAAYSGPCTLIYEGTVSWNDHWAGKNTPMRFRILGYRDRQGKAPTAEGDRTTLNPLPSTTD